MKKTTFYLLMLPFLVFSIIGCGTRKKSLQVETTKTGVRLKEQLAITTNVKETKTNKSTTYTPIDPTKPMVLPDGRTSTNTKIEEKNETEQAETNTTDNSKKDIEVKEQGKKKTNNVQTKKSNPYLWIALVALGLGGLFIWFKWGRG